MKIKELENHAAFTIHLIMKSCESRNRKQLKNWEKELFKSACRAFEMKIPPQMREIVGA